MQLRKSPESTGGDIGESVDELTSATISQERSQSVLEKIKADVGAQIRQANAALLESKVLFGKQLHPEGSSTAVNERDSDWEPAWNVLARWHGVIEGVGQDSFTARLQSVGGETGRDLRAEFPRSEVAPDDEELFGVGAELYWTVGHRTSPSGRLEQVSSIRLRRISRWSERRAVHARLWGESKKWLLDAD